MNEIILQSRLRVQWLTPMLLRLETARPDGSFCDRPSLTVQRRDYPGVEIAVRETSGTTELEAAGYTLRVEETPAGDFDGYRVHLLNTDGQSIWASAPRAVAPFVWPHAGCIERAWAFEDHPRAVPPDVWDSAEAWQIDDTVRDLYLFLYEGDPDRLRTAFLELTGPIPMPPLWALGFWTSRYYPYREETALHVIDRYREHGIPLDVFVVDTDWRVGASRGYEIDETLFPDMERFFRRAHERGVRVVFNDHPEPKGLEPLDPELYRYREESLTRLLDMGLDAWWFDRNWDDIIPGPAPGLETAVWGQYLYHRIISEHAPDRRTMVLSMRADHPAAHRFPLQWTGDIPSDWEALREGMRHTLEDGARLLPWTGQDVGGHTGFPSPEQYVRWLQWGCLSPTARIHCGPRNRVRYPWAFGNEALAVTRAYVKLRYRLLPVFYAAARRAYDTGRPLLSKLSLLYPEWEGAERNDQFLLGDDLLIAPVTTSCSDPELQAEPYRPADGFRREVFDNPGFEGAPIAEGRDDCICLDATNWMGHAAAWGETCAIRWTGKVFVDESGWYRFLLSGNGTKQLRFEGESHNHLSGWMDKGYNEINVYLEADKPVAVTVTYVNRGKCICRLGMRPIRPWRKLEPTTRDVWLPPGEWQDLWSGRVHTGPGTVRLAAPPEQLPMFARVGGILLLAPALSRTGQSAWDPITLDVRPPSEDGVVRRELYEDDGETTGYRSGLCRRTPVTVSRQGNVITVSVGPATGAYPGAVETRDWTVRVHLAPGDVPLSVDAKPAGDEPGGKTRPRLEWIRIEPMDSRAALDLPLLGDKDAPGPEAGAPVVQTVIKHAAGGAIDIRLACT
jgi:alpha-glucosidase (family GH31 glycosyl hydrolase)